MQLTGVTTGFDIVSDMTHRFWQKSIFWFFGLQEPDPNSTVMTFELNAFGFPKTIIPPANPESPKTPTTMEPPTLPGAPDRRGTRLLFANSGNEGGSSALSPAAQAAAAAAAERLKWQRERGRRAAGGRDGPGGFITMTAGDFTHAEHMHNMHNMHRLQQERGQPGRDFMLADVRLSLLPLM